jgi:aminocarboxymuconate-semialdehyde decarboxylase
MYTDTVSPHTLGVAFAVEFYGADRVIYGSDYPCWDPDAALRIIDELDLDDDSYRKITDDNARRLYGIRDRAGAAAST